LIYSKNEDVCHHLTCKKTDLLPFEFLVSQVDLQDRDFLTALAHHAQALARIILKRSDSGYHLAEDAQVNSIIHSRFQSSLYSVSDYRKYSKFKISSRSKTYQCIR
jgi:hypothetical protein